MFHRLPRHLRRPRPAGKDERPAGRLPKDKFFKYGLATSCHHLLWNFACQGRRNAGATAPMTGYAQLIGHDTRLDFGRWEGNVFRFLPNGRVTRVCR